MSGISSISGGSASAQSATNGFGALTSEEFMKIIFTELQNQDPTQPNDTKALLEQLSMIRSIESDTDLTEKLDQLVSQNDMASASSLVGMFVSGKASGGVDAAGFVDSVRMTESGIEVTLSDGNILTMEQIDEIIDPVLIGVGDGPDGQPGGGGGEDDGGGGGGEGDGDEPAEDG